MTDYTVDPGDVSSGLSLADGDTLTVFSGGSAISTAANLSAVITVLAGGATSNTFLSAVPASGFVEGVLTGGSELVYGSTAGTVISGGQQYVEFGGQTTGTIIQSYQISDSYIYSLGSQIVSSGGVSISTVVKGATYFGGFQDEPIGAEQEVQFGGVAVGTNLSGVAVEQFGLSGNDFIYDGDAQQDVLSGARAVNTNIGVYGIQNVSSGGTTQDVTLNGGTLVLDPGATVLGGVSFIPTGRALEIPHGFGPYTLPVANKLQASVASLEAISEITGFDSIASDTGFYPPYNPPVVDYQEIDVTDLEYDVAGSATIDSEDKLDIAENGENVTIQLAGDFTQPFVLSSDGKGGTNIIYACYVAGTNIRTDKGDVAVELLHEGDNVVTYSGEIKTIRWIGNRDVDCHRHIDPVLVWPIKVVANAFGSGLPVRDLLLSPDHAVYFQDVLIPIKCLENGMTIRQIQVDSVTYYHVELEQHDVIYAEGLPAESFLDTGNRSAFANCGKVSQLYPDFSRHADYNYLMWETYGYAPLVLGGSLIEKARQQLDCVAADAAAKVTIAAA